MDFVYVLMRQGAEWEDMVIYLTEKEAMEASLKYTSARIELFRKSDNKFTTSISGMACIYTQTNFVMSSSLIGQYPVS